MYNNSEPRIGDIVYPSYTPVRAGKIISIEPEGRTGQIGSFSECKILKPDGKTYKELAVHLCCFETLIEQHEEKARKQRETLEKIRSL